MTTEEDRLIEKLQAIERLFAGATTDGERVAARHAFPDGEHPVARLDRPVRRRG